MILEDFVNLIRSHLRMNVENLLKLLSLIADCFTYLPSYLARLYVFSQLFSNFGLEMCKFLHFHLLLILQMLQLDDLLLSLSNPILNLRKKLFFLLFFDTSHLLIIKKYLVLDKLSRRLFLHPVSLQFLSIKTLARGLNFFLRCLPYDLTNLFNKLTE